MDLKRALIEFHSEEEKAVNRAFIVFYEQYYKLAFLCASKYLTNREDMEDAVLHAFTILFENRCEVLNVKNYLMSVVKNTAIDTAKKKREVRLEDESFVVAHDVEGPYKAMIEDISIVLSREEMDIVVKHLIEGYDLKEIATQNQKGYNSLKSTYRRAIKKLHDHLGGKYA